MLTYLKLMLVLACCTIFQQAIAAEVPIPTKNIPKPGVAFDTKIPTAPAFLFPTPPESQNFFQPLTADKFDEVVSVAGRYSLQFPKSFGTNPFKHIEKLDDIALVRTNSKLLAAINKLDLADTFHYLPNQNFPSFPDTTAIMTWQQHASSGELWNCKLSRQKNYQENRLVLLATTSAQAKEYELLFLIPKDNCQVHLLEALYTINSFILK